MKGLALAVTLALLVSGAEAGTWQALLARLDDHPALEASYALVLAAQARLESAYGPLGIDGAWGYGRSQRDPFEYPDELPDAVRDVLDDVFDTTLAGTQLSLGLTWRPFPYGDFADLVARYQLELRRAWLAYRETRASLEAQAVEAALGVLLAERGLELAEEGLALAREVAQLAAQRYERGIATGAELRNAEQAYREAEVRRDDALGQLRVAKLGLVALVGDVIIPEPTAFVAVVGRFPEVLRQELDVALAAVGLQNAERSLWPVVQAGYSWYPDERSSLSVSIESRTLQPRLGYSYQGPGRAFPQDQLRSSFQIGVAVEISPEAIGARQAAERNLQAAQAGLRAAELAAQSRAAALQEAVVQAQRALALAERGVAVAAADLAEAERREALGLSTAIERQQRFLAYSQARLARDSAELELTRRILDTYRAYAQPLSEVLP